MALNSIKAMREYISKLVRVTQGMKVLLLDQETVLTPLFPLCHDELVVLYRIVIVKVLEVNVLALTM